MRGSPLTIYDLLRNKTILPSHRFIEIVKRLSSCYINYMNLKLNLESFLKIQIIGNILIYLPFPLLPSPLVIIYAPLLIFGWVVLFAITFYKMKSQSLYKLFWAILALGISFGILRLLVYLQEYWSKLLHPG